MKQAIRKTLALAAFGVAGLAATGAAHAGGVNWHIGINLPGIYYPEPAVVYAPPPVVYAPPPVVYYEAPPVYYRPAPVYHGAPVYAQPYPRGHWREGRWHDHGRRWDRNRDGHHDRDDDRRAHRHGDRDRHGDGRPDRYRY